MQRSPLVATLLMIAAAAAAQTPRPAFEAASVKPNTSGSTFLGSASPPGRISVVNAPLRMVIRQAFALPEYRMSGGPGWLDTDRWDIEGTAGANVSFGDIRAMTRT